jgi:hypothetical protein
MASKQLRIPGQQESPTPTTDAPTSDAPTQGSTQSPMAMQAAGGGGNAAAQEMIAQRQAEAGAGAAAGVAAAAAADTYRIEAKAWIPHDKVVDPEEQVRMSDWADTITDIGGSILDTIGGGLIPTLNYEFASFYRGDNHTGFDGTHRVLSALDFGWDGTSITGATHTGNFGATHRDWNARAYIDSVFGQQQLASNSDTETGTATSATAGSGSGNSFSLSMASANPLVMTWAPDIDAAVIGTIGADGSLDISYDTDMFPSHGIRILKNGSTIHTSIVNDASSVNALGPIGAANVGARLMLQENEGSVHLPGGGITGSRPVNSGGTGAASNAGAGAAAGTAAGAAAGAAAGGL